MNYFYFHFLFIFIHFPRLSVSFSLSSSSSPSSSSHSIHSMLFSHFIIIIFLFVYMDTSYQFNIATGICFHCAILFIVVFKWSTRVEKYYIEKWQTTVWVSNKQTKHNCTRSEWKGVLGEFVCRVSVVRFKNCVNEINVNTVETKSEKYTAKERMPDR